MHTHPARLTTPGKCGQWELFEAIMPRTQLGDFIMANAKSKPAVRKPASAVAVAVATLFPVLAQQDVMAQESAKATESRSKTIVAAIATLFASSKDYKADVVAVFGNGTRGKDNIKGQLAEKLDAAKITALVVRNTLSHARTVAVNWTNADVRKAAEESGLRKARDVAKPKAEPEAKDAGAGTVKTVGDVEMVAQLIARNGLAQLMGMIESACVARADTIRAGIVHDARTAIIKVA